MAQAQWVQKLSAQNQPARKVVMIDNYDSFTFNIVQYLGELGAEVITHLNDDITIEQIEALVPTHLVVSPGPCTPNEAGISMAAIKHFAGKLPILGVCLGHQAIGQVFGGKVVRAPQVMHGKTSAVLHANHGVFEGLDNPVEVTRYHSLVVDKASLPDCLEVTAWTGDDDVTPGLVMGFRHRELDIEGVQFHPESILTRQGHELLANFLKRESAVEISAAAQVMRELMKRVELNAENIVDIVGTGGDGANLFNVSTAASFVAAAAGAHVAKHGNRSVSSSSGSADLFDVAGIYLDLKPDQVARCIEQVGVGFMFAPNHHPAMRYAIGPRREMGVRTLFNILGPLTNPAGAPNQVLGVYAAELVPLMAEVLKTLGSRHVMVVHSDDGLDEISLASPTLVAELKDGEITQYTITPEELGIERQSLATLKANSAEDSLRLVKAALSGEGAAADMVALNAGAALYCSGVADTLKEGVMVAQDAQASKLPLEKLKELSHFTSVFKQ